MTVERMNDDSQLRTGRLKTFPRSKPDTNVLFTYWGNVNLIITVLIIANGISELV